MTFDAIRFAREYDQALGLRTRKRLDRIDRFLTEAIGSVEVAVELGAGTGRLLSRVNAQTRIAVDHAEPMCRLTQMRGMVSVRADLAQTPLPSGGADAVVSGYGSIRARPARLALKEIARLLRDGATFGLHVFPAHPLFPPRPFLPLRLSSWFTPRRTIAHMSSASAPLDLDSWQKTRKLFADYGLWITAGLLLRNTPDPPFSIRVPLKSAVRFATHIGIVGHRMPRHVMRMRSRIADHHASETTAPVVIAGESMAPTLRIGDEVLVAPCTQPKPGDIVLIQCSEGFLAHRVRWVLPGRKHIIESGDAPGAKPSIIPSWRILGRINLGQVRKTSVAD